MRPLLVLLIGLALAGRLWAAEPLLNLELREVELQALLRALGQQYGLNIVLDEAVKGKVTVSLRKVPLWAALKSILQSQGFTYRRLPSGIVLVEPLEPALKKEEQLVLREFKLRYLELSSPEGQKALNQLRSFLSPAGKLLVSRGANVLLVKDHPQVMPRLQKLLRSIDVRPQQVMIEARIVELSTSEKEALGIQWGLTASAGEFRISGAPGLVGASGPLGNTFMVNLPVTGVSEGPSAALALGYVADKVSLDLQLSALQESGAAKILSSPKVMVMEHQEALISTGTEILVPTTTTTAPGAPGTVATTTTTVTEKRATLSLRVSPRVVDEDLIALSISTSRDEFDFSKAVLGIPPKLTRTASTELLVRAGSTVVIGGIYARTESTAKREVPLLGKLPLLGWLFKRQQRSQDRVELLIFLTPQVVKP